MHIWHDSTREKQHSNHTSYVGGKPMLPRGWKIPASITGQIDMTFFFQINIPIGFKYSGHILSFFYTTDHADENHILPNLPDPLQAADLQDSFFANYQNFFKIYLFSIDDVEVADEYQPLISYKPLHITVDLPERSVSFGVINREPIWLLEDESPRSLNGSTSNIDFLLQTDMDYEFEIDERSPRQKVIDYSGRGLITDSYSPRYSIFARNALYFFSLGSDDNRYMYIVPQSD